jgi:hypothetical protein
VIQRLVIVAALVLVPVSAWAQSAQDACAADTGPYIVQSGAPFTVFWVMDATVPTSETDPTPVPNRYNGFLLQVDTGARMEVGHLLLVGTPCTAGPFVGRIPFAYRSASGVPRGDHVLKLSAWNFQMDANGTPTTVIQESAAVAIPFAAADPAATGPPRAPFGVFIRK